MFVFGFGSLMIDGWEEQFDGNKYPGATLHGYQRSFNKASTLNWGTPLNPCPTLGLEPKHDALCIGCAFEFDDVDADDVLSYLMRREGKSFDLKSTEILLPDQRYVKATTPVNDLAASSYIGHLEVSERQKLVKSAVGKRGACLDYVRSINDMLITMGVQDEQVEKFVEGIS